MYCNQIFPSKLVFCVRQLLSFMPAFLLVAEYLKVKQLDLFLHLVTAGLRSQAVLWVKRLFHEITRHLCSNLLPGSGSSSWLSSLCALMPCRLQRQRSEWLLFVMVDAQIGVTWSSPSREVVLFFVNKTLLTRSLRFVNQDLSSFLFQ